MKLLICILIGATSQAADISSLKTFTAPIQEHLREAVLGNNLSAAQQLIQAGADPTLIGSYGKSALDLAADKVEMKDVLMTYRCRCPGYLSALPKDITTIVRYMVTDEEKRERDIPEVSAYLKTHHPERAVLDKPDKINSPINMDQDTPLIDLLFVVCHKGVRSDAVRTYIAELLHQGADPNGTFNNITPLGMIADRPIGLYKSDYRPILDMLLARGALVNNPRGANTALTLAVRTHNYALCQRLLEAGADPHQEGKSNRHWLTHLPMSRLPLNQAVENYNPLLDTPLIQLLLDYGARPDHMDSEGISALSLAQGNPKLLSLLSRTGSLNQLSSSPA